MPNAQWERVVCRLLMKSIVDGAHRAGSRDDREDTGTIHLLVGTGMETHGLCEIAKGPSPPLIYV
jgi:hypothetical protein